LALRDGAEILKMALMDGKSSCMKINERCCFFASNIQRLKTPLPRRS